MTLRSAIAMVTRCSVRWQQDMSIVTRGCSVSPYARLDYSADHLNQSTETGAGQNALTYFSQVTPSVQGALGMRAEAMHETSYGSATPRIRAEYRHDFQGERQVSIAYADLMQRPAIRIIHRGGRQELVRARHRR